MTEERDELLERIRAIEQRMAQVEVVASKADDPWGRVFLAKRKSGSTKCWQERTVNDGKIADFPDGRTCDTDSDPAAIVQIADSTVLLEVLDPESGAYRYVEVAAGGVIPVRVAKDGGSNGTRIATASWTYTVTSLDGLTPLGNNVPLTRPRPKGTATFGSGYGIAFYDGTTLKLWDVGEIYGTGGC